MGEAVDTIEALGSDDSITQALAVCSDNLAELLEALDEKHREFIEASMTGTPS